MGLALDEPNENEDTTQVNGIDVLIADEVKSFADKNTIDYVSSPDGAGFTIRPESGCECC